MQDGYGKITFIKKICELKEKESLRECLPNRSINLWDLKEDGIWHQRVTDKDNEIYWVIRTPTYTTAGNLKLEHKSEVVALRVLSKIEKMTYIEM